ncbi:MAG: HU family DNA-binding protein [Planctomycetes bacterium]|nr:HU family DNA-binding protein [Planctomycetota bacterium]
MSLEWGLWWSVTSGSGPRPKKATPPGLPRWLAGFCTTVHDCTRFRPRRRDFEIDLTGNTKATKPASKSEVLSRVADATGLSRKQVASVLDGITELIKNGLGAGGPGIFVVPGLLKLKVVNKPAVPEREGINPFTGEKTMFKAKPARNVVKAIALKKLKQMV